MKSLDEILKTTRGGKWEVFDSVWGGSVRIPRPTDMPELLSTENWESIRNYMVAVACRLDTDNKETFNSHIKASFSEEELAKHEPEITALRDYAWKVYKTCMHTTRSENLVRIAEQRSGIPSGTLMSTEEEVDSAINSLSPEIYRIFEEMVEDAARRRKPYNPSDLK